MSRDEVPAEVRALVARLASQPYYDLLNELGAALPNPVFAVIEDMAQAMAEAADALASRPAAPATNAEVEPASVASYLDWLKRNGLKDTRERRLAFEYGWRNALARPAPAPQAVEEVRREAAEDERDRLYWKSEQDFSRALDRKDGIAQDFHSNAAGWLRNEGAMLPADRQRARAGQDGGA